jgi:hypothetical protein
MVISITGKKPGPENDRNIAPVDRIQRSRESDLSSSDLVDALLESDIPPDYIIIRSWRSVENALGKAALNNNIQAENKLAGLSATEVASKLKLPPEYQKFVAELKNIRSLAAHGFNNNITRTDALRYRDLAAELVEFLDLLY